MMAYQEDRFPWRRRSRSSSRDLVCLRMIYRWRALLILIAVSCLLLFRTPAPPPSENDTGAHRPPPQHYVETKPRFLHRSPFRQDPDLDYEYKLSEALKVLEQKTLEEDGSDFGMAKKIWQIMLQDGSITRGRNPYSVLFQEYNSEWPTTVVTKDRAIEFIKGPLSTIPDLPELYSSYPHDVMRADLLRYLILWYYGGYYADTDVFPARTILSCPSLESLFQPVSSSYADGAPLQRNISLVLGVEIDEPYASPTLMRNWHWSRSYGLIQYNMYAPHRFSPLLRRAIVRVLAHTKRHNSQRKAFLRPRYDERTTLEVTGPGVFTDAILDVLSETLPPTHPLVETSVSADSSVGELRSHTNKVQRRVTWAAFHRLKQPIWIDASEAISGREMGGLSVLPVSVWGNGQRHSEAEWFDSPHACINHQFGRSWKKGWWEYMFG